VQLQGKLALVTGASRGIGKSIALKLGSLGATVCVHYGSSAELADQVVDAINGAGGKASAVGVDLRADDAAQTLLGKLDSIFPTDGGPAPIDILINNAGVSRRAPIETFDAREFDETIATNLRAPFLLIKAALPRMRAGGRIVNVSSMVTRVAYPELALYSATKGGLEGLTLALAPAVGQRGITINAVRPGATLTEMNASMTEPARAEELLGTIALKRLGEPDDIADVVAFLASDQARWITGTCIEASGGQRL
jgi:3-oxoacyl-[acyl-carrier protein] reductase